MRTILLAAAAVIAISTGAQASVQLVTDGDFTDGLVGWTVSGYDFAMTDANVGSNGVSLWTQASAGDGWNGLSASGTGGFVAMDGDYETGPISQTINGLTVGDSYSLSFDYAFSQQAGFYGDTIQSLTASIGGVSVVFNDNLPSQGFSGWMSETLTFTATSASETLSFLAAGNLPVPPFALVSDVSLEATAAPEASTWAMILVGFAGLAYAARRVSKARTVAA
jgi:hypothetical protein